MPPKRTKKPARWILFTIIILVAIFAGWMISRWVSYQKAKFTHYKEFGIRIPDEYSIHGIDVSKYQSLIAWEEVKEMNVSGIRLGFAFIKATEGIGNMDQHFPRNWRRSKGNNIVRGAYHFFIATKDGKMQAENFIKRVDLEKGDLPPVLDVEQRYGVSKIQLQKEVKKWLITVEEYYKVKPVIYTNVDFYIQNLGTDFDDYPLWVAHYYQDQNPRISRQWSFWQHSDMGNVNGIVSKVDFNVFNGDSLQFKSLLIP